MDSPVLVDKQKFTSALCRQWMQFRWFSKSDGTEREREREREREMLKSSEELLIQKVFEGDGSFD